MRHMPPDSKFTSKQEMGNGSVSPSTPLTSAHLDASQSVANRKVDPLSGNDKNVEGDSSSSPRAPGSEPIMTMPSVTPVTNPRQCTPIKPSRSIASTGVPSSAHLFSINSASSDDEIKYAWTRQRFGKPLADYLAGQFNWQIDTQG